MAAEEVGATSKACKNRWKTVYSKGPFLPPFSPFAFPRVGADFASWKDPTVCDPVRAPRKRKEKVRKERKKSVKKVWTEERDEVLRKMVEEHGRGKKTWEMAAPVLGVTRTRVRRIGRTS